MIMLILIQLQQCLVNIVELSNLQCQILHTDSEYTLRRHAQNRVCRPSHQKVLPARLLISHSHRLNSHVHVDAITEALSVVNAGRLLHKWKHYTINSLISSYPPLRLHIPQAVHQAH
jgi:hypothetical protein